MCARMLLLLCLLGMVSSEQQNHHHLVFRELLNMFRQHSLTRLRLSDCLPMYYCCIVYSTYATWLSAWSSVRACLLIRCGEQNAE